MNIISQHKKQMIKNNNEQIADSKETYNFQMMLNDIQESSLRGKQDTLAADKAEREQQSKLIVLQMLVDKANKYINNNHRDDESLRNAIEIEVNNDHLAGYIFFVSQNPQFDHSWNYLRKHVKNYLDFLVNAIRFLENILVDINMLLGKPRSVEEIHVVMNDIIDVYLTEDKPGVKIYVLWENFYKIATVNRDYSFTVKIKDCILMTGRRKKASDAEKLIDTALFNINIKEGSIQ